MGERNKTVLKIEKEGWERGGDTILPKMRVDDFKLIEPIFMACTRYLLLEMPVGCGYYEVTRD